LPWVRSYKSPRKIPHPSSDGLFDEKTTSTTFEEAALSLATCEAVEGFFAPDNDFPSAGTSRSRALSL
jgi:hypothetical protein